MKFDALFECGNLGRIARCSSDFSEYDLYLNPDTNNPNYRMWFYFRVLQPANMEMSILNFVNFSKGSKLFRSGLTPLVWCSHRPQWERVPPRQCFFSPQPTPRQQLYLHNDVRL
eukprot:PhM_4_TR16557/c0_g1_i1/m.86759